MPIPPLAGKKILYAIADPAAIRLQFPELFRRVADLTFVLAERLSTITGGEVRHFDTVEDALAYGQVFDVIIVQAVGNFIVEYRFLKDLDAILSSSPDLAMMVFPPAACREATSLLAHCRMLVVNVEAWNLHGCSALLIPTRSGARERDTIAERRARSEQVGLSANMPALQAEEGSYVVMTDLSTPQYLFPQALLRSTVYIWPEVDSERLNEALVRRDPLMIDHPDQRRWILMSKPQSAIWIYNSEPYRFRRPLGSRDAYFGPAAGFKYLDILAYSRTATITLYDQNPASLRWIEELRETWDGYDFPAYLYKQPEAMQRMFKFGDGSLSENQLRLLREFGGENRFRQLWRRFRSISTRFSVCDLFDHDAVLELVSASRAEMPFFYYSNVFSTTFTLAKFSRFEAEERYRRFKDVIMTKFPKAILHGADVAGRWH